MDVLRTGSLSLIQYLNCMGDASPYWELAAPSRFRVPLWKFSVTQLKESVLDVKKKKWLIKCQFLAEYSIKLRWSFFFGFHVILEQAFHQIAATFRMRSVTTTKAFLHAIYFTVQLASDIDLTGKIFSYYAATYENHNGHNYLLLHYRSILPLSIICLVLFCGKITE